MAYVRFVTEKEVPAAAAAGAGASAAATADVGDGKPN